MKYIFKPRIWKIKRICPRWGSNSRPSDYETDALPTALRRLLTDGKSENWNNSNDFKGGKKKIKFNASAGNRTRVNCLEGSYAHHYTTDAFLSGWDYRSVQMMCIRKGHQTKKSLPWPGFEPGLLRPQRRVLTTRRSRLETSIEGRMRG